MSRSSFPAPPRSTELGEFEVVVFNLATAAAYIAAGWPFHERPDGTFVFPAALRSRLKRKSRRLAELREAQPTRRKSVTSRLYLQKQWR